jgi:hypothetical protein
MKIYLVHSTKYNFKDELYQPLIDSPLYQQHQIILPHITDHWLHSKEIIKSSDLVIAEVSFPAIGLGIELGWAEYAKVKVICIYQADKQLSKSLSAVFNSFVPYSNSAELITKLQDAIN